MTQYYTARLEDWIKYPVRSGYIYIGLIYDDVKNRWWDGELVTTSYVSSNKVFSKGDVVCTRNSSYLLGEPANETN